MTKCKKCRYRGKEYRFPPQKGVLYRCKYKYILVRPDDGCLTGRRQRKEEA